jgi:hypothetical protein
LEWIHADAFLIFAEWLELDFAIDKRKQGIVFRQADIQAGADARAALAQNNRAGVNAFAVKAFDAESLRITVATIAGRAATFFVCHIELLKLNFRDFQAREFLAMTVRLASAMFVTIIEMGDLFAFAVFDHFGNDLRAFDRRLADRHSAFVFDHQHVAQRYLVAHRIRQFLDVDLVAYGHAILFATGFQNCIHNFISSINGE